MASYVVQSGQTSSASLTIAVYTLTTVSEVQFSHDVFEGIIIAARILYIRKSAEAADVSCSITKAA
jgi:hypothetical protein